MQEGREIEVKPMGMCLARVSAIVGSGPQAGTPCIDDRICMVDSVYDYLTKFSGLQAGDLHPSSSRYYLTTLKKAYMKLRYLVDRGCIFVGHGLRQDFRMINLTVPPEQVRSPFNYQTDDCIWFNPWGHPNAPKL